MKRSIAIFGDSVSWGAWDLEKGGWVNRLWFHVAKRDTENYVEIYNQSISGGTSETILARFEAEAKIREANALIFQTGGNDAGYVRTPAHEVVPLEQFRANIAEIIRRGKTITDHIIFTDLPNCDEARTAPVSWDDYYYTNKNIERYYRAMQEICSEHGVLFLEIAPLPNEDFDDGLHPNANGHEKIFLAVKDFLVAQHWI